MSGIGAIPRARFSFTPITSRVLFGSGTRFELGREMETAGVSRAFILTTLAQHRRGNEIVASIGARSAGVFSGATMHTPVEVTRSALAALAQSGANGIVSVGGGSTIGLGKALAARTNLPQIVLPTTYAGSEMTPILGETENGVKTTRSRAEIRPQTVIYDTDLTLTLPPAISVTSGINAMAHAVEALYAPSGNPALDALALKGIEALIDALPRIVTAPSDPTGRTAALYGAWLCGICLGGAGMALHHKLCHTLGGAFNLPHAETHTVILPHALAYNAPAISSVIEHLKPILGDNPARRLQDLARRLGAPVALRDLGMPEDGIARAAELAMQARYPNPRALDAEEIRAMLRRAWVGDAVD